MACNKKKRGKIFILNKYEVEEPRFQMNKLKLEKDLSDSRRMRGKGIDRERSLVLIISYKIVIGSAYVW